MAEVYTPNVPHNHANYYHLMKYHTDEEYRKSIIKRASQSKMDNYANARYNHYKRLTEDKNYLEECKSKGLRLRKVPEEFAEILKELIKN
jgi:hypothetical protein